MTMLGLSWQSATSWSMPLILSLKSFDASRPEICSMYSVLSAMLFAWDLQLGWLRDSLEEIENVPKYPGANLTFWCLYLPVGLVERLSVERGGPGCAAAWEGAPPSRWLSVLGRLAKTLKPQESGLDVAEKVYTSVEATAYPCLESEDGVSDSLEVFAGDVFLQDLVKVWVGRQEQEDLTSKVPVKVSSMIRIQTLRLQSFLMYYKKKLYIWLSDFSLNY